MGALGPWHPLEGKLSHGGECLCLLTVVWWDPRSEHSHLNSHKESTAMPGLLAEEVTAAEVDKEIRGRDRRACTSQETMKMKWNGEAGVRIS